MGELNGTLGICKAIKSKLLIYLRLTTSKKMVNGYRITKKKQGLSQAPVFYFYLFWFSLLHQNQLLHASEVVGGDAINIHP